MKILFVTTDYPERGKPTTGLPNYLYRVSIALRQMGHDPIILTSGRWNAHRTEQEIDIWSVQVEHLECKSKPVSYAINALHKSYILNKKIRELLNNISIDVIQFTSLEGIALFYREKVPSVLRLSSYAKSAYSTFQTCSPITVKVMSFIERSAAYRCNAIFAPCSNTAQIFSQDIRRKVKVIETPFINDVKEYDDKYVVYYLKNISYVLFYGTLYAEKGILVIADILEEFLEKNQQYYFLFIGNASNIDDINYIKLLKEKAGKYSNRVIIWNALPHKQLYPIIMQADFVVLPSLMENLSNSCIEAMYFEKLVIGTNGASFEQLISHGINGLLCEIGNSKDLLEKMQMVVSMNQEQKKKIGKRARIRIDRLAPNITVNRLLKLYEHIIKMNERRGRVK